MSGPEQQNTNSDAGPESARRRRASKPSGDILGDARRVADDATSMVRNAKQVGADLRRVIRDRPLQSIGTAVGAGFVLGGGLSPALLRSLTGIASRLAMVAMTRRFVAMFDEAGDAKQTSQRSAAQENPEGEDG